MRKEPARPAYFATTNESTSRPPSFASFLHKESSKRKVNFRTLEMEKKDLADVLIPMSSILKVHARWLSVIATRLGTPIMLDSCTITTCIQSWRRMDYTRALVVMRALKDIMVISVLKLFGNGVTRLTIKVEYEWKPPRCGTCLGSGGNHSLPKKKVPKFMYQKKSGDVSSSTTSTSVSNTFLTLGATDKIDQAAFPISSEVHSKENNGKSMNDMVDDTRKKVETNNREICIWLGRKTNSPKRNLVFFPRTKLHYFERDDMEFADTEHVVEVVEYGNVSSKNG
nr:hypothetical protein [Tanacetum cinerariifolium]GEX50334.1 hypothetical protein [Tanacetum cinerariifolium]